MKKLLLLLMLLGILQASDFQIGFDKPYIYTERVLKKGITVPENPATGVIDGFKIDWAKYKNFDKLKLNYDLKDKTRLKKVYEGKFWNIKQKRVNPIKDKQAKREARAVLLEAYKSSLKSIGAKIYKNRSNTKISFVFNLDNIWGVFTGYDNSFDMKLVQIDDFKQSLKIDPDKLLAELQKSGKVKLEGIYFDTNKATLKPQSKPAILAAAALLKKYPTLKLEVQGHTDSVGSDEVNLILSDNRATSVKNALIKEGIETKRLKSKGYGEQVPAANNDTDEGRAQNRRVMLKKISGSDEKALITIDFMKPMPGFQKEFVKSFKHEKMHFRINKAGKKAHKKLVGDEVRARYSIIDKKDRTYSHHEILKNYENVLTPFGAEILGKGFSGDQSVYFYIKDRGDGKEIYGIVKAFNAGIYTISFLMPNQ